MSKNTEKCTTQQTQTITHNKNNKLPYQVASYDTGSGNQVPLFGVRTPVVTPLGHTPCNDTVGPNPLGQNPLCHNPLPIGNRVCSICGSIIMKN